MKQRFRLARTGDFDRALRSGRSARSPSLAVYVSDNGLGRPRVGLTVSRKLGGAVVRNRIKRRLRELAWPLAQKTQAGLDVVIVARGRAMGAAPARLREELEELWARVVESR